MKFLLLYPDRRPEKINDLRCFSDVWGYYLGIELTKHAEVSHVVVPGRLEDDQLSEWFDLLDVNGYDVVLALGLRYFSSIPRQITENLRKKIYPGFLCQIYDGSRLDNDGVDVTFTIKNEHDEPKYQIGTAANRYVRHRAFNEYVGWAADPTLNFPNQDPDHLRLLVDHTNYAQNPVDRTDDVLLQIQRFVKSGAWKSRWKSVTVRRFDSGKIVTVDVDALSTVPRYNRSTLPYQEVCQEHCQSHVFFVTHPESVGLVVLETAMAGALIVTPEQFIPQDRLNTVNHVTYSSEINWKNVLDNIDPDKCRNKAQSNTWEAVAKRMRDSIKIRQIIRGAGQ
jgi:hypothetical protein